MLKGITQYLTSSEQRVFDMAMQPILCTNEINVLLDTLLHKYTHEMYNLRVSFAHWKTAQQATTKIKSCCIGVMVIDSCHTIYIEQYLFSRCIIPVQVFFTFLRFETLVYVLLLCITVETDVTKLLYSTTCQSIDGNACRTDT